MGLAFIQTTLFWVFVINYSSKLEYLPTPNYYNCLIDLPIGQNNFSAYFVMQNSEKN